MMRTATSDEFNIDFNSNNNSKRQEQVISFLEERESASEWCQQLLAEIQMLLAMFDDAKVYFMFKSNSSSLVASLSSPPSSGNHLHLQQRQTASDEAATSSSPPSTASSSSSALFTSIPAINISVPLRTLQSDGQSTLASVLLSIVLEEPHLFPNSSEIAIRFKSGQLSPQLRTDLADSLLSYAKELQAADSLTVPSLASRAEEMLLNLPVSVQSKYFGCCLNCNKMQLLQGLSKFPAPLRLMMDDKENILFSKAELTDNDDDDNDESGAAVVRGTESSSSKTRHQQQQQQQQQQHQLLSNKAKRRKMLSKFAQVTGGINHSGEDDRQNYNYNKNNNNNYYSDSDSDHDPEKGAPPSPLVHLKSSKDQNELKPNQCLMCKSDLIIFIPSMKPTKKTECSFCYCEDHPLISFPNCKCISCFDCFIRFGEIAVGEKKIKRPIYGYMGYGIACPNHPRDSLVNDVGLMKMLPRRSYFRFNSFAVKELILSIGGFLCANPRCGSGLPQVSSRMKTGLTICFYCDRATCLTCGLESVACECTSMLLPERVSLAEVKERLFRNNAGGKLPVCCPIQSGDVLFVVDKTQKILTVPFDSPTWSDHANAYVWYENVPYRKLQYSSFVAVFNGAPLNPSWTLAQCGVHPGSIIYLIPFVDTTAEEWNEEQELWKFRRLVGGGGGKSAAQDEQFLKEVAKKCPGCGAPSVHYRYHNCHHLSCKCGKQWCFGCGGSYPCAANPKCPIFCNENCTCRPCPECKPMMPCSICPGCPACKPTGDGTKFS